MLKTLKIMLIFLALMLSFLSTSHVFAQDGSAAYVPQNYVGKWWLNFAPIIGGSRKGGSEIYNADGVGFNGSINIIPFPYQLLTVSASTEQVDTLFFFVSGSDTTSEYSALYGLIEKGNLGYASLSTGVSRVHFEDDTEFVFGDFKSTTKHSDTAIGLPLQAQLFWTPFQYVGFGAILYANFNHIKDYYGGGIGIQVGNLK